MKVESGRNFLRTVFNTDVVVSSVEMSDHIMRNVRRLFGK